LGNRLNKNMKIMIKNKNMIIWAVILGLALFGYIKLVGQIAG